MVSASVLVWRGVPMRVAGHVAVGGACGALGRRRPHRRQRDAATGPASPGRGVALVRVTALLQQFLKLRAFVLKPYLHLESAQRSLGPKNIRQVPIVKKKKRQQTRSPQGPAFLPSSRSPLHFHFHPPHPYARRLLGVLSGYLKSL